MNIGEKVIIKFNPHHDGVENIVGTIKSMESRRGSLRVCDLAYVEYFDFKNAQVVTMPFGIHNLQPTSEANLIEIAEFHESMAVECRRKAEAAKDNK